MLRKGLSRRDFLKHTATCAAAGLAAPYFFTSTTANAATKCDKLTVASIGVGGRGSEIGRQAAELGHLVACADVHLGNAHRFAGHSEGKCQVYQDYRQLLDRKDVEAVTIGTPDHWHVKIAIDAMKAGKHVYCEKPLTLTLDEGNLVCAAVRKYRKTFQVGTQQRSEYDYFFLKAVAIARSGRLGKNLHATSSVGPAGSVRSARARPFGPFPTADSARRTRLGPVARPGPQGAVLPRADRLGLPLVVRVLRRPGDRLGRPPHRHRLLGPGRQRRPNRRRPSPRAASSCSSRARRSSISCWARCRRTTCRLAFNVVRDLRRRFAALHRQHHQARQRSGRVAARGRAGARSASIAAADRQAGQADRRRPRRRRRKSRPS